MDSVSEHYNQPTNAGTQPAPSMQNTGGGTAVSIFEVIVVLFVIVLGIIVLAKFLKKRVMPNGSGVLEVLEIQPLMQNRSIAAVKLGDQVYLLGVGNDIRLLDTIQDEEIIEKWQTQRRNAAESGFDKILFDKLSQLAGQRKNLESWDRSE